jgi:CRISPR-associated protein Cas2
MRYLVCYDIADDRRRDRVATALLDFGPRLQESVFLVDLDEELFGRMKRRIVGEVDEEADRVHVVPVCEACFGKVWYAGLKKPPQDADFYIV